MLTPLSLVPIVQEHSQTQKIIISSKLKESFESKIALMNDYIFQVQFEEDANPQEVYFSNHTKLLTYQMDDLPKLCQISAFQQNSEDEINILEINLYYKSKMNEGQKKFSKPWLSKNFIDKFCGGYINNSQNLPFTISKFEFEGLINIVKPEKKYGYLSKKTQIIFKPLPFQNFVLVNYSQQQSHENSEINNNQRQEEIDLKEKLLKSKAGGLNSQIQQIYRRIFTTRRFSGLQFERLGIKHAKGMILYGPPGTGKTLLARELAAVLDVKPTIINGPQIMDKYVGQGERKLREIFKPAIEQYNLKGSQSDLHVIIFDEIDSIAKRRGNSDSQTGDTLVNQLLTLIDGIQSPDNILVIGMTNRLDLIDEALLRPGRLEVHVQIFLPSQQGRKQIFDIHLKKMASYGILSDDVDTLNLAKSAKNYTGAQIQSMIKSSFSFAVKEHESVKRLKSLNEIKMERKHFQLAKMDITPQFGQDEKYINSLMPKYQINFSKFMPSIEKYIQAWLQKCKNIQQGKLTLLIKGVPRTGKTVLAGKSAKMIDLSFTKWVSCDRIYSLTQSQRMHYLVKVLQDSKRCSQSCIILDGILRLIEYVNLGQKYNNNLLQLLKNIIESSNQKGKKKVIIATCDSIQVLDDLGLTKIFSDIIQLNDIKKEQAISILQEYQINLSNLMLDENQNSYTIGEISQIIKLSKANAYQK